MATILESLQGIIGAALPPLMSRTSATIFVRGADSFTPGSGVVPSYTEHAVKNVGFVDREAISLRQIGALQPTERAVLIYVAKLPSALVTKDTATGLLSSTLKIDDEITISGQRSKLVREVSQDPAQAVQTWAVVDS